MSGSKTVMENVDESVEGGQGQVIDHYDDAYFKWCYINARFQYITLCQLCS